MSVSDADRSRVQDDLRGLVSGEVHCDAIFSQLYASDGSVYEIRPLGVVRPRSTRDVAVCLEYAADKSIPVHARGGGTGLAGGALGQGLVIDFSRYLRRILRTEAETVRVQAGAVHERLNAHLAAHGRIFGPDPATSVSTTVGSMIAVDASGSRWLRYGSVRNHVLELEIVLADGTVLRVGREPLDAADSGGRKRELVNRVRQLLDQWHGALRRRPAMAAGNPCGYRLDDVVADGQLHLARLLVGSRGTLALITEAVLSTDRLPAECGVVLFWFDNMQKAARAVLEVLQYDPTACDLVDRRHLTLARELAERFQRLVPAAAEAAMLVEVEGGGPREVEERLGELAGMVCQRRRLAFDACQAVGKTDRDLYWQLIRGVHAGHYPMKGSARPVPVLEDLAVGPEQLPEFLIKLQNVLKRHELIASFFCHAGQGRLQVRPFLDLAVPEDVGRMRQLAADLYQRVREAGGTVVAGGACGLSHTGLLAQEAEELEPLLRGIKEVFDPANLLNPGKLVGGEAANLTGHLRPLVPAPRPVRPSAAGRRRSKMRDLMELQLDWDPTQVADTARRCNGCGQCRAQNATWRMCPMFRALPAEESSPRAKANLLRGVLTGQVELAAVGSDQFKQIADLCFHCYMCVGECPARVDIPRLMLEAKGAYVAANGLRPSDWLMARLDVLSALGSLVSPVANWALGSRLMRWLLEKLAGIAQGRKLPRFAPRPFMRIAAKRKLTRPSQQAGTKVAYLVDTYANYYDPQLAEAFVAVLQHQGISVFVPPEQRQAGTAAVAMGAVDVARKLASRNASVLAEAVRQGYHVVATEPAAALCLKREYPNLLADEDVRLVAENTSEACAFLWNLHEQGRLKLDFKPLRLQLGYHVPCRLIALGVGTPGEQLARLIPGVTVQRIEEGCSGMAGTFGLRRANYRASLRIGRGLIARLRDGQLDGGLTECSACKIQMEQGTPRPTIHPIKLLAWSYGLMPEVGILFDVVKRS